MLGFTGSAQPTVLRMRSDQAANIAPAKVDFYPQPNPSKNPSAQAPPRNAAAKRASSIVKCVFRVLAAFISNHPHSVLRNGSTGTNVANYSKLVNTYSVIKNPLTQPPGGIKGIFSGPEAVPRARLNAGV